MLITIDGSKGSGKTFLMAKYQIEDHKTMPVSGNYSLFCDKFNRWQFLHQIFGRTNESIGIDEGWKLFDARRFMSFPPQFAEMVAGDRHDHNKIYITTQGFDHIDKRVRENTDILISVSRIFRLPFNPDKKAFFQLSHKKVFIKKMKDNGRIRWQCVEKKFFVISFLSKKMYNTYENFKQDDYYQKLKWKKKKPTLMIVCRSMVENGKKRI